MSVVNVYLKHIVRSPMPRMESLDESTLESIMLTTSSTATTITEEPEPLWIELMAGTSDLIRAGLKVLKSLLVFSVALFWVLKALTQTFSPLVIQGLWCLLDLVKVLVFSGTHLEEESTPVVDQVLPAKLSSPSFSTSSRTKTVSSPSSIRSTADVSETRKGDIVSFSLRSPVRSPVRI